MPATTNLIARPKIIPLRPPRPPSRGPRYLTLEELARFKAAVEEKGSARDVLLFALAYRYGLRSAEVVRLRVDDLDLERGRITIPRAKGGLAKEHPLSSGLVSLARRWLRARPKVGEFLFVGRQATNQQGLSVLRVRQLFKEYARAAGLAPDFSSHSLRHSVAVHAIETGVGIELVADLLGHRSVRSTEIYARVSSKARDEVAARLDRSPHVLRW